MPPPDKTTSPLRATTRIVDPETGMPTVEFLRQWLGQNRVNSDVNEFADDIAALVGSTFVGGIGIDVGGAFPGAITIDLEPSGVTAGTYGDSTNVAQITVDAQGRVTSATEVAIGASGGSWTLADSWDFGVSGATASPLVFDNLGTPNEIMIVVVGVTKSVSGNMNVQVSLDNGATWLTTSGDYQTIAQTSGTPTNTPDIGLTSSASTAARSPWGHIHMAKGALGVPVATSSLWPTANSTIIPAATSQINAIRLNASGGGNFTGGVVYVYTR